MMIYGLKPSEHGMGDRYPLWWIAVNIEAIPIDLLTIKNSEKHVNLKNAVHVMMCTDTNRAKDLWICRWVGLFSTFLNHSVYFSLGMDPARSLNNYMQHVLAFIIIVHRCVSDFFFCHPVSATTVTTTLVSIYSLNITERSCSFIIQKKAKSKTRGINALTDRLV